MGPLSIVSQPLQAALDNHRNVVLPYIDISEDEEYTVIDELSHTEPTQYEITEINPSGLSTSSLLNVFQSEMSPQSVYDSIMSSLDTHQIHKSQESLYS